MRLALSAALALSLLALPACTPPASMTDRGDQPPEEVDLSRYEDFDPSRYREEAPGAREEEGIEHDVPARLLSGEADAGVTRTVQGYRVQILSSRDKSAAEEASGQATQWWREQAASSNLFASDELPIYTVFRQPYYRVRVGNFASRQRAERALDVLNQRYGDAFIVRTEVTVTD